MEKKWLICSKTPSSLYGNLLVFTTISITETMDSYGRSTGYTYAYDNIGKAPDGCKADWTHAQRALRRGEGAMGRVRINQTKVQTSAGIWNVTYNAENRPTEFIRENADGTTTKVTCTYDYMGRRATKKVETIATDGTATTTLHQRYLYRGYLQVACCDLTRDTHPCLWLITWDPTQPIATRPLAIQKDATWYTYGWDLTKNICEVFGADGLIKTTYRYTPYGAVTAEGTVQQSIQWSSEFSDDELGLVYYNYRHYCSRVGKWLSRDRCHEELEARVYGYVRNATIGYFDVLGNSLTETRVFDIPVLDKFVFNSWKEDILSFPYVYPIIEKTPRFKKMIMNKITLESFSRSLIKKATNEFSDEVKLSMERSGYNEWYEKGQVIKNIKYSIPNIVYPLFGMAQESWQPKPPFVTSGKKYSASLAAKYSVPLCDLLSDKRHVAIHGSINHFISKLKENNSIQYNTKHKKKLKITSQNDISLNFDIDFGMHIDNSILGISDVDLKISAGLGIDDVSKMLNSFDFKEITGNVEGFLEFRF